MAKGFRYSIRILFIIITVVSQAGAQSILYNPLYGPPRKYMPVSLVKRLSYENFKHIKQLTTAIMNFGGGESEVDRLVDQYAEASALFFQNKYDESADTFLKNEKEILKTAKKLMKKYHDDSDRLLKESIKLNIRENLKKALKGEEENSATIRYLNSAKFAIQKANDIYDRYKNAQIGSPKEIITAIYYYRRAKENMFYIHEVQLDEANKKKFFEKYKKDLYDNNNKVYKSRVKQN